MPGGGDIKAGGAYVELLLKDNAFLKGLRGAKSALGSFSKGIGTIGAGMAGIGTAIVGPLTAAATHFANVGSDLNDMSARTGIAGTALAELGYAAEQTGASMDDVEGAVRKMQKFLGSGATASESTRKALHELGLTFSQLKGQTPDQQFQAIADKIAAIPDPSRRAAAAMEVFGKKGTQILPMLEELASLRGEASSLGLAPSQSDIAAADALGDSMHRLTRAGGAFVFNVGAAFAPIMQGITDKITGVVAAATRWVSENREVITTIGRIAAGAVTAGGALGGFAIGAKLLGGQLSTAISGFKLISSAIGLLTSPVALVAGGLLALGGALAYLAIPGDSLAEKWDAVKSSLLSGWNAIRDGAMQIFAAVQETVLVAWDAMQASTSVVWDAIGGYVIGAWNAVSEVTASILSWIQGAIIGAFSRLTFTIKNWKLLFETAFVSAEYAIVKFANQTIYFFTVAIPGYLSWFADHWREVFTDIVNFTATVAVNIWENLKGLWNGIVGLFSGEGFTFEWTPLTKGFESAIKELPKIAEREIGALEAGLKGDLEKIAGQLGAAWDQHDREFKAKIAAAAAGREEAKQGVEKKTEAIAAAASGGDSGGGGGQNSVSTFSAAALSAIGAGGVQEDIAEATKGTWEEMKQARRDAFLSRHREGVFGA